MWTLILSLGAWNWFIVAAVLLLLEVMAPGTFMLWLGLYDVSKISMVVFNAIFPVITAIIALYFNSFVAVVQSFEKVPALHAMAPTQKEPPFLVAQLALLALFIALVILSVKKFRTDAPVAAQAGA